MNRVILFSFFGMGLRPLTFGEPPPMALRQEVAYLEEATIPIRLAGIAHMTHVTHLASLLMDGASPPHLW